MSADIPAGYRKVGAIQGGQWFSLAKTKAGEPITYMLLQQWKNERRCAVRVVKDGATSIYCAKRL